jgi:hypothetical protein
MLISISPPCSAVDWSHDIYTCEPNVVSIYAAAWRSLKIHSSISHSCSLLFNVTLKLGHLRQPQPPNTLYRIIIQPGIVDLSNLPLKLDDTVLYPERGQ